MALFIMDAFVMSSSSLAAVIIGNEILAGRRNDAHLAATVAACNARGLRLQEVVYLGDDHGALVAAFRRLHAGGAMILSFGGIGATPDTVGAEILAAHALSSLEEPAVFLARLARDVTPLRAGVPRQTGYVGRRWIPR